MQVLTHFPLLKALGWALFNSLWQMAALWLLYSLLIAIFHSAAARIRHSVALLLLCFGTVWTGVTFLIALFFPDNGINTWLLLLSPTQSVPGWFWQTTHSFMDTLLSYGSSLYLLIIAGLLIRYSGHYWYTRRLTRNGLSTMPAQFRVFVTATSFQLGIRKPVKTWLSSLIDVPLTLGFLKPVILLPAAMISQLTPQQVEAILIHELGHIRRKDYLLHLLVTILEGLFFFNPFSRLLIRHLKHERENCCDDLVLQFKYEPHAYVSALLTLASRQQAVQKLALAATGTSDKLLLQRARRILLQKEANRSRPGTRALVLLLFTALITTLAVYKPLFADRRPLLHNSRPLLPNTLSVPQGHGLASATAGYPRVAPAAFSPADFREIAFNRPIRSTRPPVAPAHPRQQARFGTRITHEPEILETDDNNIFLNTADDAANSGDITPTPLIVSAEDMPYANNAPGADNRDYSLNMPATIANSSINFQQGAPIVPNSSFSFQYTLGDSAQSKEQLIYLQQSAQREVLAAIAKLQQQTAAQLKTLADLQGKAKESVHLRRQIHTQQQKLQLEYFRKITTWQHKLEETAHIRVIVYI